MPRRTATPENVQAFTEAQAFQPTRIPESSRSAAERGRSRIMYIELKSGSGHTDRGTARIGRVTFSKSGRSIYYRTLKLQSLKGAGICANYVDVETGDEYWVSGCKKNGQDRHWAGGGPVEIDEDVREEYWRDIKNRPFSH
jgi:hypothetical protein